MTTSTWARRVRCPALGILTAASMLPVVGAGCATRTLVIEQDPYINTAMHKGREAKDRTGEQLEVHIVCVFPADWEDKGEAEMLAPDKTIPSRQWFNEYYRRGKNPFGLSSEQIYVLTDNQSAFGTPRGPALRGAKVDGKDQVTVKNLRVKKPRDWKHGHYLFAHRAVMYVFANFGGDAGDVPPAKFYPLGSYGNKMRVKIGVRDPDGAAEQYIEIVDPKK